MKTLATILGLGLTVYAATAHAQSSLPDGRDGRELGQDLYQYRGDREGIMKELGRGGGMDWGMGGGHVPAYQEPKPRPCCGDPQE
jgi:hypothetical protein